nr:ribosomal protein S16 [Lumnitzera racemosa]
MMFDPEEKEEIFGK